MTLLQRDRENREIGREEGLEEGLELGTRQMAILTKQLIKAKRFQDLERATDDDEYRKKLYQELGI